LGITFATGSTLYMDWSVISDWATGIRAPAAGQVFVRDSIIRDNTFGLTIQGSAAGVERSTFDGDNDAIRAEEGSLCVVSDTGLFRGEAGITAVSATSGVSATVTVESCRLEGVPSLGGGMGIGPLGGNGRAPPDGGAETL